MNISRPLRFAFLSSFVIGMASSFAADLPPGPQPSVPGNGLAPGDYPNFTVTAANWTMDASAVMDFNSNLRDEIRMNLAGQGPLPWSLTEFGQGRYAPRLNVADPQAAASNLDQLPFDIIIDGTAYQWENDLDPWPASGAAWRPHPARGILLASVRRNGQQWSDGEPKFYGVVSTPVENSGGEGYSMIDGSFGPGDVQVSVGKPGPTLGGSLDTSVAWFPYDQGWLGGHVASADFEQGEWLRDGLHHPDLPADPADLITWSREFGVIIPPARLQLPGVNARTDGMLFTMSIEDTTSNTRLTAADPSSDGSGWDVMIRGDNQTDHQFAEEFGLSFSFLYIPYDAINLIGGHIRGSDANVINGRGTYSIDRLAEGRYELTIPGKQGTDGMLLLGAAGRLSGSSGFVGRNFLSYEPTNNQTFVIESHFYQSQAEQPLEDTDFYFAWIDFATPIAPPGFEGAIEAPTIAQQPSSANIELGASATFTVVAQGTEPFICQWNLDGTAIDGAAEASLTIANATLASAGNYTVDVTNAGGKITSEPAVLKVLAPPQLTSEPASLDATTGDTIQFTATATGTAPLSFQWQKDGTDIPNATSPSLELQNISLSDAGQYRVRVSNEVKEVFSVSARLTVRAVLAAPTITQQPSPVDAAAGDSVTMRVVATGTAPLSYQWQRESQDLPGQTQPTLTIANAQSSDAGNYRVIVSNEAGSTTSSFAALTVSTPPPASTLRIVTAPQSQVVTPGSNVTFTVVAEGVLPLSFQWRVGTFNIPGARTASFAITNVQAVDEGEYQVVVTDGTGDMVTATASLTVSSAPVIAQHPQSQTITEGNSVTFEVVAQGTPPLSYQWQYNGVNIPGARNQSFTVANVQDADAGAYAVVVADSQGQTHSQIAILTVIDRPDTPTLVIDRISITGNTLSISWAGGPGIVLQAKARLSDAVWQDVPGTDGQSSAQQLALGLSAYFRLIQR